MALSAETAAPGGKIAKMFRRDGSSQFSTSEPASQDVQFRRNLFRTSLGKVESEGGKTGKAKEVEKPSEFIGFKEATRQEHATFLNDYLTDIALEGRKPGGMDTLRAQPDAEAFFHIIGADKDDFDPNKINSKVQQILATPEGWMMTKALIEHEAALAFAIGGVASAAEGVDRSNDPNDAVRESESAASPNYTRFKRLREFRDRHAQGVGVIGGGLLGGGAATAAFEDPSIVQNLGEIGRNVGQWAIDIISNNPVQAPTTLAAGALGAAIGKYVGRSTQGEQRPKAEQLQVMGTMLESVQNNPALAKYIKARFKIDVTDYKKKADGSIEVVAHNSVGNIKNVIAKAQENLATRGHYYDDLGIPPGERDIMPEQFLITGKSPERHGERLHQDIMDRYRALGGKDGPTVDNLKKFRQARELVMADLTESIVTRMKGPEGPKSVTVIQQKIDAREGSGDVIEKRRDEKRKDNEALEERQSSLQSRIGVIESYDGVKEALEKAKEAIPKYLSETFSGGDVLTIEDARRRIQEFRKEGTPISIRVDGQEISFVESLESRRRQVRQEYNDQIVELMQENPKGAEEPLEIYKNRINVLEQSSREERETQLANINSQGEVLSSIESRLKALEEDIKQKEEALNPKSEASQGRHVALYLRDASERQKALDLVIGIGDLWKLTPAELLKKVNELHKNDPSKGWDEMDNEDLNTKEILNYALIVERVLNDDNGALLDFNSDALLDSNSDADREPGLIYSMTAIGITYEQIENMDVAALKDFLNGKINPLPDDASIQAAKDKVEKYAKAITRATRKIEEETTHRIARNDREADSVDIDAETARLETAKDLMLRQGTILGMRRQVMADPSTYFQTKETPGSPRTLKLLSDLDQKALLDSEKALEGNTPAAYLKMMDVLFDYKNRPDADAYFKKISGELSPDELFILMQEGSHVGQMPEEIRNAQDFSDFLNKLQDNIRKGLITLPAMRKMFITIIDSVQARAMALP